MNVDKRSVTSLIITSIDHQYDQAGAAQHTNFTNYLIVQLSRRQLLRDLLQQRHTIACGSAVGHTGASHVDVEVASAIVEVLLDVVGDELTRA